MNRFLLLGLIVVLSQGCKNSITNSKDRAPIDRKWWKEGILYQIYPQSFKDSDGDGFGDFKGVVSQMDYIQSLGVNIVWMNPFFESPWIDNGYDVADYKKILARYGTNEDFQTMLDEFHKRGIKFVLDVVVNHSSNEHSWFKASRSSRDSPYRSYYHWWPAEKGKPPNRYSIFDPDGAWEYDSLTNAYYLHTFAEQQPDLNWENPKLRQEVYDIMKYWAEKGVDGFRMDAFQFASKDTTWPVFPEGHEKDFIKWYGMRPQLHDYLREMYSEVISKYDIFAVAEGAGSTFKDAHDLVDAARNELQMAYHFESVDMSQTPDRYKLSDLKEVFTKWDSSFTDNGWIAIFLANHDKARLVNRFGNPSAAFRTPSTQMLNTFLLSMKGTPYCYYGDEIGMTNIDMPDIKEYKDVEALGKYQTAVNKGQDIKKFMEILNYNSRENGRTPMQWNDMVNAGFTTGVPWTKANPNYKDINVEKQEKDPNSILQHFRRMTKVRKENETLVYGKYELIQRDHPQVYAYKRTLGPDTMVVLLNFSDTLASIDIPSYSAKVKVLINNYETIQVEHHNLRLQPYQAVIFKLN